MFFPQRAFRGFSCSVVTSTTWQCVASFGYRYTLLTLLALKTLPFRTKYTRSGRWGSNPRPPAWEAGALPTELRPRISFTHTGTTEPEGCMFSHPGPYHIELQILFRFLMGHPIPQNK